MEEEDKEKVASIVKSTIDWLDTSEDAPKAAYEEKRKELDDVVNPILQKIQGKAQGGAMPGEMPTKMPTGTTTEHSEPEIEEID